MRFVPIRQSFFHRPTLTVARELLGKHLCRRYRRETICRMITEVEAYDGPNDKASHAARGMTERNKVMFGPPGCWYVYFTYGMHWLLNIVTGPEGYPAAVLIRGVEGIEGPARVTKFFKIHGRLNSRKADRKTGLWVEDKPARRNSSGGGGVHVRSNQIVRLPRIGVHYAGPMWAKKPYRFLLIKAKSRVTTAL